MTFTPLPRGLARLASAILPVALVLVAAIAVRSLVIEPYVVPSPSMEPTLLVGDVFLGEKWDLGTRGARTGDVVTFSDPRGRGVTLVKRVVATAGQEVDVREGALWVDGERLDEPYANGRTLPLEGSGVTFPVRVPEGTLWLMGDNREDSSDSRAFGAVPESDVTSRAWIRVLPWPRRGWV